MLRDGWKFILLESSTEASSPLPSVVIEGGILEGHCKMEGTLNKEDDLHGEVMGEKN